MTYTDLYRVSKWRKCNAGPPFPGDVVFMQRDRLFGWLVIIMQVWGVSGKSTKKETTRMIKTVVASICPRCSENTTKEVSINSVCSWQLRREAESEILNTVSLVPFMRAVSIVATPRVTSRVTTSGSGPKRHTKLSEYSTTVIGRSAFQESRECTHFAPLDQNVPRSYVFWLYKVIISHDSRCL